MLGMEPSVSRYCTMEEVTATTTTASWSSSHSSLQPNIDDDLHPFDEDPVHKEIQIPIVLQPTQEVGPAPPEDQATSCSPLPWQTLRCLQALALTSKDDANISQDIYDDNDDNILCMDDEEIFEDIAMISSPTPFDYSAVSSPLSACTSHRHHPWTECFTPVTPPSPPRPMRMLYLSSFESIGPATAQVYKISLPRHLVSLLDPLVAVAEAHAQQTMSGWSTSSLTSNWKMTSPRRSSSSLTLPSISSQDLPTLPGGTAAYTRPIADYLASQIQILYHQTSPPRVECRSSQVGDVTIHCRMHRAESSAIWLDTSVPCVALQQGDCLLHPGYIRASSSSDVPYDTMVLQAFFTGTTIQNDIPWKM